MYNTYIYATARVSVCHTKLSMECPAGSILPEYVLYILYLYAINYHSLAISYYIIASYSCL